MALLLTSFLYWVSAHLEALRRPHPRLSRSPGYAFEPPWQDDCYFRRVLGSEGPLGRIRAFPLGGHLAGSCSGREKGTLRQHPGLPRRGARHLLPRSPCQPRPRRDRAANSCSGAMGVPHRTPSGKGSCRAGISLVGVRKAIAGTQPIGTENCDSHSYEKSAKKRRKRLLIGLQEAAMITPAQRCQMHSRSVSN